MSILILRLAGPLQSWGTDSKLKDRSTGAYPSKSGVLGMLAAAQGRSRDADLSDLAELPFGVAVARQGSQLSDIQNATKGNIPYIESDTATLYHFHKTYLQDAVFYVGIECEHDKAEEFKYSLMHPAFPLFLGRRGCPVTQPLVIGISEDSMESALVEAARADDYAKGEHTGYIRLILEGSEGDMVRDVPVSFDPHKRVFAGRRTIQKGVPYVPEQSDT